MTLRSPTTYVALDFETTGLLAERDRVVEIGGVRFDRMGRELGRFETLVNPGRPMSPGAQAVHGLSDAKLTDCPRIGQVLPGFLDFLGDPNTTLLLAHNASFDASFLGAELGREGRKSPGHRIVDTLTLSRRQLPDLPSHRLDSLAVHLGLDDGSRHRALADSLRVKDLWLRLDGPRLDPASLTSYPIHSLRSGGMAPCGWDRLAEAAARGWRIRIRYEGGTRGPGDREVTPRGFVHRGGIAYLVAHCHLDDFEKSFRLDRVKDYQVVR